MKYLDRIAAFAVVAGLIGCSETSGPTDPQLEQAVFTALGGLEVGEALVVQGADAAQVAVGGSASAGEYVFIPFNGDTVQNANLLLSVRGENVGSGVTPTALQPVSGSPFRIDPRAIASWEMHQQLHERLQRAAETRLPRLQRSLSRGLSITPRSDLRGNSATVGELVQLNTATFGKVCEAVDNRTGRVEAITQRAIVVGDVNNPSGGFTRADYESFGREFDTLVHPTVTQYFDNPTDIDQNGKVIIFVTRAVNELTGPNDDGFVGGFFYARDLFPRTASNPDDACPASNEGEIFYVLAPDPLAEASPIVHTRAEVFNDAVGTIGHEYEHLINAGRRIYVNDAFDFEESWMDEGLAHIAEEVLFYKAAGIGPKSNISQSSFVTQTLVDAINRFGIQNIARYALYIERVTEESPTGDDDLETRGAAWSFLRYLADHTESSDEELFKSLVNSRNIGFTNLQEALGPEADVVDWFRRWGVSVYTDDLVAANSDPLLMQPSWNFRNLVPLIFGQSAFPLPVETVRPGETLQFDIRSMSSGYARFTGQANEIGRILTTSGGASPPETLRVTVVRIR